MIAKVAVSAEAHGLSMSIADPVWRTMMDRCIAYEFTAFDALASKAQPTNED